MKNCRKDMIGMSYLPLRWSYECIMKVSSEVVKLYDDWVCKSEKGVWNEYDHNSQNKPDLEYKSKNQWTKSNSKKTSSQVIQMLPWDGLDRCRGIDRDNQL